MKIPKWAKTTITFLAVAPAIGGLLSYVGFDLMGMLAELPIIGGVIALMAGLSGAYVLYNHFV